MVWSRKETLVDDPVYSHLSDLRNKILKEGLDDAVNYTTGELNPADLPPTPDWADKVFIGDRFGGSGYIIEGKDEEELKIYRDFDLPQVETGLYFRNLSDSTDRDDLPTQSVEDDLRYYLRILREIVSDAKSEFGSEDLN